MPTTLTAPRSVRRPADPAPVATGADPLADARTLQRLERALRTLLAPLDHPDWQTWQVAVHGRLLELTGADSLAIHTPLVDGPGAWYAPHLPEEALALRSRRIAVDPTWELVESRFARLGRDLAHQDDLCSPAELQAHPFHREFLAPNRIHDLTVAGVDFGAARPARLYLSHTTPRGGDWAARRGAVVRAILPAFRAALALWRELGQRRAEMSRMLDALPQAAFLYEASGTLVHANPGAAALLAGADADADRLRAEAQRVASAAGALVRLGARTVRLQGAAAPGWMLGGAPGVLVMVESATARPLTDGEVRERFGLTTREAEVARLVADGLSNQEIADRIGVSFFTARNHVERLLPKLGASNRTRVGTLLRGEA